MAFSDALNDFRTKNEVQKLRFKIFSVNPRQQEMTNAELQHVRFQSEIVDGNARSKTKLFIVIEFGCGRTGNTSWVDIRKIGIERSLLKLIDQCNERNDIHGRIHELRRVKSNIKTEVFDHEDIRKRKIEDEIDVQRAFTRVVTVPAAVAGLIRGRGSSNLNIVAEMNDVKIRVIKSNIGKSILKDRREEVSVQRSPMDLEIIGDKESVQKAYDDIVNTCFDSVVRRQFKFVDTEYDDEVLSGSVADLMEEFRQSQTLRATIVGAKSPATYVVACKLHSFKLYTLLQLELLGLQCPSYNGETSQWINKEETDEVIISSLRFAGELVGKKQVDIRVIAAGYASGTTTINYHGLLYCDGMDEDRSVTSTPVCGALKAGVEEIVPGDRQSVNEILLRRGYCKLMQSAVYFDFTDPRSDVKYVRSLFPYGKHLDSTSSDLTSVEPFHWSYLERKLLYAQRDAASSRRGLWRQVDFPGCIVPPRRSGDAKRLLFIDNSNLWISGQGFKGELDGLGFAKSTSRSKKFQEMFESNEGDSDTSQLLQQKKCRDFIHHRRPYFACDRAWRVDYRRLISTLGYEKERDPPFTIAGSIPPANEDIWREFNDIGSTNLLTRRTMSNVASGEDQTLVTAICECWVEERRQELHLTPEDDIFLCAGDRGYILTIKKVRQYFPNNRIFIVAWASTNCFYALKAFHDEDGALSSNVFFINLDPYVEALTYSSMSINELQRNSAIKDANRDERLIIIHEFKANVTKDEVVDKLKLHDLLEDRDYRVKIVETILYIILTSEVKPRRDQLCEEFDALIKAKKSLKSTKKTLRSATTASSKSSKLCDICFQR